MQLDWTTYLLEIMNFLILVWILQRFFYRPVIEVIARRRSAVEQTMAQAETTLREAQALKSQFDGRLADWEREKQHSREALQQELDAMRKRRLSELEAELAAASERARVRDERRLEAALQAREREALALASRFGTQLLQRVAGPELEAQLVDAALQDLANAHPAQRQAIGESLRGVPGIRVISAYPLPAARSEAVRRALTELAGGPVTCSFEQDPALLGGLRMIAGPWILRANLQDDLLGFASIARDGRQG